MECGLDGGPSVSYGKCKSLSVLHKRAYELLSMVSWEASGLENERGDVEMWRPVKFVFFFRHVPRMSTGS